MRISVPIQRLKYCTHEPSFPIAPDDPILTEEMFQEAGLSLCQRTEIGWTSTLEHFEAEQPALDQMLKLETRLWAENAAACLDLLVGSIYKTFKEHFSAERVSQEDLQDAVAEVLPYFHKPEVCVCDRYQASLMRSVIQDIESFIDDGTVTLVEGNRITMLSLVVIEALDQAATLARLAAEKGLRVDQSDTPEEPESPDKGSLFI